MLISTCLIRRWKIGHTEDSVPSLIELVRTKIFKECSKVLRGKSTLQKTTVQEELRVYLIVGPLETDIARHNKSNDSETIKF